jgi:hypothetical protein
MLINDYVFNNSKNIIEMKKITLLLAGLFIACTSFSQLVKLAELSAGKLVNGTELFDRETDDIYGYFYIFQKDKLNKTENLYEYTLLDKNLNNVSSGEFKESKLYKGKSYSFTPVYRNGFISIGIRDDGFLNLGNLTYRLLDIKDNKLSDDFTLLPDLTKKYNPEIVNKKNEIVYFTYKPNSFGYTLYYWDFNKIYFVNEKLDTIWSYSYNEGGRNIDEYTSISFFDDYDKHNKNIVVAFKSLEGKANDKKIKKGQQSNSYLFFDKNNGKLLSEIFPFSRPSKVAEIKDVSINSYFVDEAKQTVTFISRTINSKKVIMDEDLIQGFSKTEYSLTDGKELKRDYFSWSQLSQYLNIDEDGYVREKDDPNCYLYLHDVLKKDNGNTIYIMEENKPSATVKIGSAYRAKVNDLFFMELDSNMKVVQFQRIDKEKKTVKEVVPMTGSTIEELGYFDYSGYQDLGNDNYLFFYYNKQKPEDGGKKQWILGIVSYIDGKFSEQKLPLQSEDGSDMLITPAKKGYIMIYETFKDKNRSPELRLEKINC